MIKEIVPKIKEIEAKLSKSKMENNSKKIDLNDANWQQKVKELADAFQVEHKDSIHDLTSELIDAFVSSEHLQRHALREALSSTKCLKSYVHIHREKEGSLSWFKDELALIIIKDLGEDSRDALLELNHLVNQVKAHSIEVNSIITQFSELANTDDKHGMGSMRDVLGRVLELNPSGN